MKLKYIVALALFALMMLGGAVTAETATTSNLGLITEYSMTPLASGCENFCGHCLIINGDGACDSGGACC